MEVTSPEGTSGRLRCHLVACWVIWENGTQKSGVELVGICLQLKLDKLRNAYNYISVLYFIKETFYK